MVNVGILHNTFDEVFVLFCDICVDLFHETGEFAVERLDLIFTYLQQAIIIKKEVLSRAARQPLLLHPAINLLLTHFDLILL